MTSYCILLPDWYMLITLRASLQKIVFLQTKQKPEQVQLQLAPSI